MLEHLQGTTPTGLWCMALVSVGAFLFGFDNGWWGSIQGAERFLRDFGSCRIVDGEETCSLSTGQLSAGSAVQSAGIMVGCFVAVYVNDNLGRRRALVFMGVLSIVGVIIEMTSAIGSSARFDQFVVGKTIAAIAMGLAANIVPIYLSETSTNAARGFSINMYQNIQVLGFVIAMATVYGSSTRDGPECYLIPMGLQLLAPTIMVFASWLLPESPRWLILRSRTGEATDAARKLFATETNDFDAQDYVDKIAVVIQQELALSEKHGWLELLRGPDLRRLSIAVGIQCLQQAQGSSYMNNFIVPFLQANGIQNVFPVMMGLNVFYYLIILSGHYLPDRFGRRTLLIQTSIYCAIALFTMTIMNTVVTPSVKGTEIASIVLIYVSQFAYGVQGPLVWITTAEVSPSHNRERVLAVAVFFGFGVSLLVTSVSPYIQNEGYGNLGAKIGFIWASFSVITAFWVYFVVPEMKGFSLEQLDYLYESRVPTRKFKGYKFVDAILVDQEGEDGEAVLDNKGKAEENISKL